MGIYCSKNLTCFCGRVVSKIHSSTLILTCLWTSKRVLTKALQAEPILISIIFQCETNKNQIFHSCFDQQPAFWNIFCVVRGSCPCTCSLSQFYSHTTAIKGNRPKFSIRSFVHRFTFHMQTLTDTHPSIHGQNPMDGPAPRSC